MIHRFLQLRFNSISYLRSRFVDTLCLHLSYPSLSKEKMDPSPEITLIKDLDITKSTFNLKVKVLRLWTQPDLRNIGEIFSIEMILMDEEHLTFVMLNVKSAPVS
ncbi:hypothetical protein L2E82_13688 [Cichorium intybus]|uniref:Uncharacterized protein n=1 Tax=Cichorium intybus TaxID=13427 RepID=A0ACB9EXM2_CICIN|nr:hypothetical protein L2E82_13688 [Cichorium intybus]